MERSVSEVLGGQVVRKEPGGGHLTGRGRKQKTAIFSEKPSEYISIRRRSICGERGRKKTGERDSCQD